MMIRFFAGARSSASRGAAEAEVDGAERLLGNEEPGSSKRRDGVATNAADALQPSKPDERDRPGRALIG
jgi:hypothetical protein